MKNPMWTLAIALGLAAGSARAVGVRLVWDPSPSPLVTNYCLYCATNGLLGASLTNAVTTVNVGTNLTVTLNNIAAGDYQFAVTAWATGVESGPSNVLPVEIARPPANLQTLVLQVNGTLSGTNWQTAGFFRLQINPP